MNRLKDWLILASPPFFHTASDLPQHPCSSSTLKHKNIMAGTKGSEECLPPCSAPSWFWKIELIFFYWAILLFVCRCQECHVLWSSLINWQNTEVWYSWVCKWFLLHSWQSLRGSNGDPIILMIELWSFLYSTYHGHFARWASKLQIFGSFIGVGVGKYRK